MAENNDDIGMIRSPRVMPNDMDAEMTVLSCMLFDNDGMQAAYEMLSGSDFYRPQHKVIFEAMVELFTKGEPVELTSLKSKLENMGLLEQVGGTEYLINIAGFVSTSARVKYYAKLVLDKSILRKLIKTSGEISELSYDGKNDVDSILESAEEGIFNIVQNRHSEDFVPISEVLKNTVSNIEKVVKNKSKITGVETGFADFDMMTAGLQPSDLILIAARPSMGKTAFALNIVEHATVRRNVTTAVFSLEMSKEQLVNRLISSLAIIDSQKLRTGTLEQDDWNKIAEAVGWLSESPIYIDDTPGVTAMEIRSKCRKLKLEKNLGLIVIDYLQLMSGRGKTDSRQQEISEISRSLKAIAREMNVPVIALSQLSRAPEQRADHRPMLSDLRESGAIEQDADIVCFLYRDEYYNPEGTEHPGEAEVIIAKQRNGSTGTVNLMWLGQYTRFGNLARAGDIPPGAGYNK